jgi:predicted glycosyltransferase
LSPERLAQALERAVSRPPTALAIDMGGAHRTAQLVARMIENPDGAVGSISGFRNSGE